MADTTVSADEINLELNAALAFVRGEITEHADDFDFDDAVAMQDSLLALKKGVDAAYGMLQGAMLKQLEEQPRQFGGRIFGKVKRYKKRHDHNVIANAVYHEARAKATDPETGEVDSIAAIKEAISIMQSIYVMPSSTAKVTPLKGVVDRSEYEFATFDKWDIERTVIDPEAAKEAAQ